MITNSPIWQRPFDPSHIPDLVVWLKGGYPGSGTTWGSGITGGRTAALSNTTWGSGNYILFNGTTSYATITKDSGTTFSGTDHFSSVTLFGWSASSDAYNSIYSNETPTAGMTLLLKSNQKTAMYFGGGSGGFNYDGLGSVIPFGTATLLVATYDGSSIKTYINGVLDVNEPVTGTYGDGGNFAIGNSRFGRYYNGSIYDNLFYRRALTAKSVARLAKYYGF